MTRLALAVLLIASAALVAQDAPSTAIVGVTVIDTAAGRPLPDMTVIIRQGAIVSVAARGPVASGARRIDGAGKFLIPGLWDMHAHLQMSGEDTLPVFVAAGVMGVRDMGSDADVVLPLKRRTGSGELLGPTIVAAGPILDERPPDWPYRLTVRNAAEARAAVATLGGRGVDLIKVHDRTAPEAYSAIAEETKARGLHFAGHLPRGITIDQAIAAGQRSLEHLGGLRLFNACSNPEVYSADGCRSLFAKLATASMWQTPTLVNWRQMFTLDTPLGDAERDHLAYLSPGTREFLALNRTMSKITPEGARSMVEASRTAASRVADMQRAGVGILAGCDGMVTGFCLHDELALMVEGGMPPAAALQTATINPARYLGREASFGSVQPGRRADLILLDANPLDDIRNIGRIRAVVVAGRLLDRNELDGLLAAARRRFAAVVPK